MKRTENNMMVDAEGLATPPASRQLFSMPALSDSGFVNLQICSATIQKVLFHRDSSSVLQLLLLPTLFRFGVVEA